MTKAVVLVAIGVVAGLVAAQIPWGSELKQGSLEIIEADGRVRTVSFESEQIDFPEFAPGEIEIPEPPTILADVKLFLSRNVAGDFHWYRVFETQGVVYIQQRMPEQPPVGAETKTFAGPLLRVPRVSSGLSEEEPPGRQAEIPEVTLREALERLAALATIPNLRDGA